MYNKRHLHHIWRQVKKVKVWQLLLILIFFTASSLFFLRQNNLGMIEHRRAVIQADEQGNDEKIEASLIELRSYVSDHMNTTMNQPVQLANTYEKIAKQRLQEAAQSGGISNQDAYRQAERGCQAASTITYAECVIDRTSNIPGGSDPITDVKLPDPALFSHNFASPIWSPDVAGFSILFLAATLLLLIIRIVGERILHIILKHKFNN